MNANAFAPAPCAQKQIVDVFGKSKGQVHLQEETRSQANRPKLDEVHMDAGGRDCKGIRG
jgi:hypothetical protein